MSQPIHPLTRAESSEYHETSTHAHVLAFIDALAARGDPRLAVSDFGNTPQGRRLPLLVLSAHGYTTPAAAHASGLPVVLVICGIHAGEVEGKEAMLMLVRDVLDGAHAHLLEELTLVVVPLFNADGNDALSADNRRLDVASFQGQDGPEKVGTRVNAAGINLNRDYMRQEGAEMRLLQARVAQAWNAHLVIDCHATNGSIHRFAMTFDIPHVPESGRREPIEYMRTRLLPAVQAQVKNNDALDSHWYGNFLRDEGGEGTGWITYTHHPRFGGNYRGLTNRLDLLLETYSYLSFAERVRTTYAFLRETLLYVAANGAEIVTLLADCLLPPQRVAVRYRLEAYADRDAQVLTREPYTLTGAPISVTVPYIGHFVGAYVVERPLAYAVPANIAAHLQAHGLAVERPAAPLLLDAEIASIRGMVSAAGRTILEADSFAYLDVDITRAARALPEGWCLVRTAQQRGAIAVYLCEAGSDDGLLACGLLPSTVPGTEFPAWRVHGVLGEHAAS